MSGRGSEESSVGRMFGAGEVNTFLGLPAASDPAGRDASAALIGAPCVTPYRSVGPYCADAPRAIRDAIAPYSANLHHVDFDLGDTIFPNAEVSAIDLGDLPFDAEDYAANRLALRTRVGEILDAGAVPVVLGGDDSAPIPMFEALAGRDDYTIVQVDAHIDWRDEVDGEHFGLSSNMRRASEMEHIKRIIQIGQRGIGSARPGDYDDALAWGVEFYPARALHGLEMSHITDTLSRDEPVIIAIDIDGMDPTEVPAVVAPGPGGLGYWQCVNLIHAIATRARIAAFSLVELKPDCDVGGRGALVAARLVVNALAMIARQARR